MDEKIPLTKQDWIEQGLKLLAEGGVEAVGVEPLAARLKVTKGSFYWHFKNRAALLTALRDAWEERSTRFFINHVKALKGTPQQKLEELFVITGHAPRPLDRAIRAWALTDATTAERVRAIDDERTDFTTQLLLDCGHDKNHAEAYARLIACFVVGESMRSLEAVDQHRRLYAMLFAKP